MSPQPAQAGIQAGPAGSSWSLERLRPWLICALLPALVLAVFWRVTRHEFVAWDDDINVYENPALYLPASRSLSLFWKGPYLRLYIPLTYTVWTAAAQVFRHREGPKVRFSAPGFHAVNLLFHLLSALAAFALLRRLLRSCRSRAPGEKPHRGKEPSACDDENRRFDWAAGLGALFFALHPIQVEPVAWVSGLRDVLSGLGALCALEQYAASVACRHRGRSALHYLLATAALVAALLSKPSAVVIPLLAAILDIGVLGRRPGRSAASLWPWLLLALASALLTQKAQGAAHIRAMVPLWTRPLIAADSLAFYLCKLFWPMDLSPDYGRAPDWVMARGLHRYTWILPAVLALLIRLSPWKRIGWVAAGLFVAAALPVLGFVPFLHQDLSTVADRYVSLSLLGPALALAWLLALPASENPACRGASRWAWGTAALAVALLGARSGVQAGIWSNTGTLFGRIVALNPDSGVAHLNLGNYLAGQGRLDEARSHFLETLRLRPGDGLALNNLGGLMARQGKLDEALSYFRQALGNGVPDNVVDARNALGVILAGKGRAKEALEHYAQALRINPRKEKVHFNLAVLLSELGQDGEAATHYKWAVDLRPDFTEAHRNLAMLLAGTGDTEGARRHFAVSMGVPADSIETYAALGDALMLRGRLEPAALCYREILRRNPNFAQAHNSLGFVLGRLGRRDSALAHYREAVRLRPDNKQAQFNLGITLLEKGRLDEAVAQMGRALETVPDAVEIHHNLGTALLQKGRKPEAIAQFQAALRLNPGFEPSRKALGQISP